MLTPSEQRSLAFLSLSSAQKELAAGRFSALQAPTDDDIDRISSYFDRDMTTTTRKFILGTSTSILFLENRVFKIISSPSLTVGRDNRQTITGHFGDKLLHPNPISISGDAAVLDVLVVAKKPDEGTAALDALMASTHSITDIIPIEDPETPTTFPFPHMGADEDPMITFENYYVSRLPVAVPLPMGHGIDPVSIDNEEAIGLFFVILHSISPYLQEWAQAMIKTADFWEGLSLSADNLGIPDEFLEGLTELNPMQGTIYTKSMTVDMTTSAGKGVITRIESARNQHIDIWISENPTIYHDTAIRYSNPASNQHQEAAIPTPTQQVATVVKTRADSNDESRMKKAKASMQLFLVRPGTSNVDGTDILITSGLDPTYEDLLQETPRNAFRNLNMLFRTDIEGKKERDPMHLMYFSTLFPYVIINAIFTAALMGGHWATEPVHVDSTSLGQTLGVLTFAPTKTNTAEHKRQIEETNSILGEDLVGASSSQRTKASLTIFEGGHVSYHAQAMSTIANLHAALAVCDGPDQTTPAISMTCLKEAFCFLAQPDMKLWVDRFSRGTGGEHLPYSLILDLHNSWIHLARFATNPKYIRAVLNDEEIPASALTFYKATHSSVISKWQKAVASDTLGPYVSPPSTWVSPKAKEQAKKAPKHNDLSTPGGSSKGQSGPGGPPDRRQTGGARALGSDPNFGLIIAPDSVRNGPQLSSGKRLCLAFARKGKSCTQGFNCPHQHVSTRTALIPDLQTIEKWVADTPNVSWSTGRPHRLNETLTGGTVPPTPPANSGAPPVTPEAAVPGGTGFISIQALRMRAFVSEDDQILLPPPPLAPPLTNAAVRRILRPVGPPPSTNLPQQQLIPSPPSIHSYHSELPLPVPARSHELQLSPAPDMPVSDEDMIEQAFPDTSRPEDNEDADYTPTEKSPRLTDSMHPRYLEKSALAKAWEAQKQQKFGKDNLSQAYTTEPVFCHVLLFLFKLGFLVRRDLRRLFRALPPSKRLYEEYHRVKELDWRPLCQPNMNWQDQLEIDPNRVDMRMSMLFHFNMDLAAVHRAIGGNHVGTHRNADVIISRLEGLLDQKILDEIRRILEDGCPAKFNEEGTHQEFAEMLAYGNHPSLTKHVEKVMKTMNKEDRKDQVLTFPAWLARFIQHLMTTPQGFVMIPGKNDRLVFDASYMLNWLSRPFNHMIDLNDEPDIIFGGAYIKYLTALFNLRISFPNIDIYPFDDDVTGAFRQPKYNPNVISAKAYIIDKYLFVPTGSTFGDCSSPPSFEPFARARMALSREISRGLQPVPEFSEYLDRVKFGPPPPPGFQFPEARADQFNPGIVTPTDGSLPPVEYNMHVDDNLYGAAGPDQMRWAMRCSIAGLIGVLGDNEPDIRPSQPDTEKFFKHTVSHTRRQLGYITDTRTMSISIPTDKREELLSNLVNNWGPISGRNHFTLTEAAELLGILVSMCRICPWGIFLFQNLYQAMYQSLARNAARIWHSEAFRNNIALRDTYSKHPTDSSKYRFFSKKVSRAIWDVKSHTFLTTGVREELAFITKVFSDPSTYRWESPIAHLIKREHDFDTYQDSCLKGAGGFSPPLRFWWIVEWHDQVVQRTKLPRNSIHRISINLLEYAAIIIGLAGSIVAWEMLPLASRPSHPMVLLWTDNTTAKAWTKKISGLKTPQGRTLARIFSHLLMFSDVGIEAGYIEGEKNTIADYLSRIRFANDFSSFSIENLQTKFSCLKSSRPFLPSNELVSLLTTALLTQSVDIPTTRVKLGLIVTEPTSSNECSSRNSASKTPSF